MRFFGEFLDQWITELLHCGIALFLIGVAFIVLFGYRRWQRFGMMAAACDNVVVFEFRLWPILLCSATALVILAADYAIAVLWPFTAELWA